MNARSDDPGLADAVHTTYTLSAVLESGLPIRIAIDHDGISVDHACQRTARRFIRSARPRR
jgi:hypothetical protein